MASQISIFETLPVELLEMIFQYLRESPYSLSSLTLACRKFYVLGTPTPYSSIRLTNPASSDKIERTFHQNSWLSSLGLELQVHSRRYLGFHESQPALEPVYLGAAFRGLAQDSWVLGPNEVVFHMEQLEKLHLQGVTIEYLEPEALAPKSTRTKTALKDLAFLNCDVSPGILEMILTFPEGLSHFTMKDPWSHPSGAPDGWEFDNIIHPREYIKKIKKSSSANLEYLDLDLWHAGSQPDFDSLCCLKHLTTFTMMPEFDQMEWDKGDAPDPIPHLPGSLETLELNDFAGMGISFASLAGRVEAGTLPNLRVVKYRKVYGPDGEETEQEREDWGYEVRSLEILGVKLRQDAVHLTPVG